MMNLSFGFTASLLLALALPAQAATEWCEAESFSQRGGWVLDTQFIDIMGSPYLMAHGLGEPVADAKCTLKIKEAGKYNVWVRAKNWVGHWDVPGAPGKFQVSIAGKKLAHECGTMGKDWQWELAGVVDLEAKEQPIALHDLTGFNGRCDAIFLTTDSAFQPPQDKAGTDALRKSSLNLPAEPEETQEYDLVVIGGGYAGMGAAISAARQHLKVAFLQDRPVLGGNGSSEVQVWAQGNTRRGLYPHLGEIIEEFADRASNSPAADPAEYNDALKEQVVRAEKTLDLFLNTYAWRVQMDSRNKLKAVIGLNTTTHVEIAFCGKLFVDCTGHGSVGALAGAEFMMEEKGRMGMSNMWVMRKTAAPQAWPDTPWSLPLNMGDFPEPKQLHPVGSRNMNQITGYELGYTPVKNPEDYLHGEWFWESGFNKHPIQDLELIRDHNFRAVFGAVSALKKEKADVYGQHQLSWLAYIGGPRESRRIVGDLVLSGDDMVKNVIHPDGCVPTTWDQDLHYPKEQYAKKFPDNPFISRAEFGKHTDRNNGYPVPYRCFYSRDVGNLFMAGRTISVDRHALGSTRVMRTCGMMGEVIGKAAWVCVRHHTTPRGVYEQYLDLLKDLMNQPGAMRRDSLETDLYLPKDSKKLPEPFIISYAQEQLEGLVIDDAQALLTGKWEKGEALVPHVGKHYQYSGAKGATARFPFSVKESGKYEVSVAWQQHEKRAKAAPVKVICASGSQALTLDQTQKPKGTKNFEPLGIYEFKAEQEGAVVFSTDNSQGAVHIDAVQLVPVK